MGQLKPHPRDSMGDHSPREGWPVGLAVQEKFSLTCLLRQRPQEIEGCSLDPDAARQDRTETGPLVGGRGCRAIAEP